MANPHPTNVELCHGEYTALRNGDAIYLFASGVHETPGYRAFFEEVEAEDGPSPEFRLWHLRPEAEKQLPVTGPFCKWAKVVPAERTEHVVVHDAYGRHEIRVKEAPDWAPLF